MTDMPRDIWAHLQIREDQHGAEVRDMQWRTFPCDIPPAPDHIYSQYTHTETRNREEAERMQAFIDEKVKELEGLKCIGYLTRKELHDPESRANNAAIDAAIKVLRGA